ncbi:MAG: DNRLRE domain-containing protein [Saprospiraceae bacterium]|nr:DNRLRE domain-containing protein [Saprospiraceae bacterium]
MATCFNIKSKSRMYSCTIVLYPTPHQGYPKKNQGLKGIILGFLLLAAFGPRVHAQTTITLTATEDTEIWNNNASDQLKNYGSCNILYLNGASSAPKQRDLVRFNLSSIPANATITSATFRMVKIGGSSSSKNISVHRVTAEWVEGTGSCPGSTGGTNGPCSWQIRMGSTAWATHGGDYNASAEATVAVAGNGAYNWTITSLVQNWQNGIFPNFGVLVRFATENQNSEIDFGSSEHATTGNRPQLTVTYTVPTLSSVITNATCPSGNNGAVDLTVTGGTPGYNYAWTGPNSYTASSQDISGRIPGTYSVTVTDANGFQAQASYTVSGPLALTDTDGDSVINDCDSDDDNDGILDTNECGTTAGNQQLNYGFYDGSFTATSQIPTSGALATGLVSNFDINTLQNTVDPGDTDSYGIRYTGFINIATAGTYTFYTTSDDGSRLFINNTQVVDNDFLQPPTERSGTITLTAGWHSLGVLFFENGGGESFSVSYEGPSTAKQALPFSILSSVLPQTCTDTDGDGIVDRLDNDSDNDGCVDAIEGSANFTAANINGNGRLTGGVGTNGVPIMAGAGQTVGNSKIATQLVVNTPPANSSVVAPAYTSFAIATTASNNTSWTGPTNARVPVYGTTGNANAQRVFLWYLGNPDAGGTALTNTGVYSGVTTATLNITNTTGLSGNVYYVVVTLTNNECTREIRSATLINACASFALTPTVTQPTCFASGSISLNARGGTAPYTYDWADVPSTNNPQNRVGLAAGTYNVTVTDAKGCTVASGNITLNAASGCTGVTVCRSETARVFSVAPDPAVVTYNWTVPTGAVITFGQGTPSITVNFTAVTPGAYTVCCSTQNDCGTSAQTCQNINVNQATATATASPVCTGGNLNLYASGGRPTLGRVRAVSLRAAKTLCAMGH